MASHLRTTDGVSPKYGVTQILLAARHKRAHRASALTPANLNHTHTLT